MFGDSQWQEARCGEQLRRYQTWLDQVADCNVVAIEFGAGLGIPTVRIECEEQGDLLIRINPREAGTPADGISVPLGALEAITRIDKLLSSRN
jgi:hypothetical protein